MQRTIQFRSPRNPLEWAMTIVAVAVLAAVGIMLAGVAIVVIGGAILLAPILGWWHRRQARFGPNPRPSRTAAGPSAGPLDNSVDESLDGPLDGPFDGPIVDAEFKVRNDD